MGFELELQPDSIRVMGDKSTARETMKNAGVPTVPGSDGLLKVLLFVKSVTSYKTYCKKSNIESPFTSSPCFSPY